MLRLVTLMNVRSHVIANAAISPYRKGEIPWPASSFTHCRDKSVTLLDKGFFGADLLLRIQAGRQRPSLAHPGTQGAGIHGTERYGDGDRLLQMTVSPQARKKTRRCRHTGKFAQ